MEGRARTYCIANKDNINATGLHQHGLYRRHLSIRTTVHKRQQCLVGVDECFRGQTEEGIWKRCSVKFNILLWERRIDGGDNCPDGRLCYGFRLIEMHEHESTSNTAKYVHSC